MTGHYALKGTPFVINFEVEPRPLSFCLPKKEKLLGKSEMFEHIYNGWMLVVGGLICFHGSKHPYFLIFSSFLARQNDLIFISYICCRNL